MSIKYKNNIVFFRQEMYGEIYMPVLNILGLPITKGEWKSFSETKKEEAEKNSKAINKKV